MKSYGSKICLVRPCTCCSPKAKQQKLTGNRSRERQKAKELINKELKNGK